MFIASGILYSLSIFLAYYLVSIEVHQYYSLKRFLKIILERKRLFTILILIKLLFLICITVNKILFISSEILVDFIVVSFLHPLKYKKTRRNILLLGVNLFFNLLAMLFCYYFQIIIYYYALSIVIVFLSNILSLLFLMPFENAIRIFYINKAKRKLSKMPNLITIGITGSFGKTTLKSYLFDFLSIKYHVCSSKDNINTLMGITKMINDKLQSNHQILLLELGIDEMNGFDKFKSLIRLDYAFITGIGPMHLATFKNEENILKAKLKIKKLLKNNGKLIVNGDDPKLKGKSEESFSKDKLYNIQIRDDLSLKFYYEGQKYLTNTFSPFSLPYFDALFIMGKYLFYTKIEQKRGLENIKKVKRRFFLSKVLNTIVIDDTYNNSSSGLRRSIEFLSLLGKRKALIFTRLVELGKDKEKIYETLIDSFNDIFVIFVEKTYISYLISSPHIFVSSIQEGLDYALREGFDVVMITSPGEAIYLH